MKTTFNEFINENAQEVGDWAIFAGLGGGFGGANFQEVVRNCTKEEAEQEAYQSAIQEYESYEDLHFRTIDEIMEEDGFDNYEDAEASYNEEREGWLDYWVEPYDPEKHGEL